MPQREFWTQAIPTSVVWRYECDPKNPEGDGWISVSTYDQAGKMMERATCAVPHDETLELVDAALRETWLGYLFGEREDAGRALAAVKKRFRRARALRRLQAL